METMSLADVFWLVLVLTGVLAEVLERRKARRDGPVPLGAGPVPEAGAAAHATR